MNALANSQYGELEKFIRWGFPEGQESRPIRHLHGTGEPRAKAKRSWRIRPTSF